MNSSDTLVIRHLSNDLTDLEKEHLLKHFGAIGVKCLGSELKKSNLVFAKFPSTLAAKSALKRLHQLDVLGKLLTVEYARGKEDVGDLPADDSLSREEEKKDAIRKKHKEFVQKLNSWSGILQPSRPPPHHLRYEYPPATMDVLTNICRALASVPKFLNQVLHLMNRMNLPCPFGALFPGPELYVGHKQLTSLVDEEGTMSNMEGEDMEESEESEMEETPEENQSLTSNIIPKLPVKRRAAKRLRPLKKRLVISSQQPVAAGSSSKSVMLPEEVFEREASSVSSHQKKIELNLATLPMITKDSKPEDEENKEEYPGFGVVPPSVQPSGGEDLETKDEAETATANVISWRELKNNRISTKDQKILPVFKNYQPGAPSCRLYVKNIAKQVEDKDLRHIYSLFLDINDQEQLKMFDIRLMQEGRMKGQAFITLPSVAQAKTALSETNGYILRDKPLVVQFARSAKPK